MPVSKFSFAGLAALAGLAVMALPASANAAASSTSTECSAQYKAAKADGTLNGKKWPQFYSDCAAKLKDGQTTATAASDKSSMKADSSKKADKASSSMTAKAPSCTAQYKAAKAGDTLAGKTRKEFMADCKAGTSAMAAPEKAAPMKEAKTSGHQTTQQICSGQYQEAKTAGTLKGQKWPQFYSDCAASIKNDTSDASTVPDEPKQKTTSKKMANYTVPKVDKNGKPLSAGQIAFRQRIHECSVEWQSDKAANKLKAGQKWPQYWSACNTRLKQEN